MFIIQQTVMGILKRISASIRSPLTQADLVSKKKNKKNKPFIFKNSDIDINSINK